MVTTFDQGNCLEEGSQEESFQSLFENAVIGIFRTSPEGRYISANRALARLYGFEAPEQLIERVTDIQNQLYVDPLTREHFSRMIEAEGAVTAFESQVRTADGRTIWISESARAVTDEDGRIRYYEGTVKDVTARRLHEDSLIAANEELERRVAERTAALERSNSDLRRILKENDTLAAAIAGAHFGVLISDPRQPDNPCVYINAAFESMTGYSPAETLGKNCRFLQGPDTDQKVVTEMRNAISERRPFNNLLLNYRKDGTPFWNDLAVNPVFNSDGELVNFVGLQVDVTERVKAQEALQESRHRYERISSNAPGIVFQFARSGTGAYSFPFASEGCRAFCGIDPEALQADAQLLIRQLHAEDASSFHTTLYSSAATLLPWKWQGRFHHQNGEERWMQCAARPERQPNGDVLWDGFAMDVTQLHRAQQALRDTEARKSAILETALDAFIIIDDTGAMLEVNPAAQRIFGYSAPEMIGRSMVDLLIPPHLQQERSRDLGEFLRTGQGNMLDKHLELRAQRADGTEFPIELAITAIHTGLRTVFTGHIRDITERNENERILRQAKEEAERANAGKSEFLSRMSHELRTPLNAILGFSQLLQRRTLDERQAESVQYITKAGRHLLELVNEVLDLSKIEAGRTSVSLEPVQIHEILQESLGLVQPSANERGITLTAETGGHFVMADRQRLKQVFVNLLSNAIKYNRSGGSVTIRCSSPESGLVAIAFQDTGTGIAEADMPRLFVAFERLGADDGVIEGTGIGLAISHRLVGLMQGSITVDSHLGSGSTFTVTLPGAEAPQARASSQPVPAREAPDVPLQTVLYIEDNPANLRLMEEVAMEHPGIRLVTGTHGSQALDLARQWKPSLVLLDLHLPDLPGEKVLQAFLASPDLSQIPIVIVSADALDRQVQRLLKAGATDYISKPIDVDQLLSLFDRHLCSAV